MARRLLAFALLVSFVASSPGWAQQPQRRQGPPQNGPRQITFKDILVRELRVRFAKEEIFVDRVVRATERDGSFSQPFILAIVRNAQMRNIIYPFPYFQAMMVRVAEVKGVQLRPL